MDQTEQVLKYIFDYGATGVLAVAVIAFLKGWLISKSTHDDALNKQMEISEKSAEIIGTKICEDLSASVAKGVKQAIIDGYFEINNGRSNRA